MKPFFGYPGGKSRAVSDIKARLCWDNNQYNRVVEIFSGGASFSLSCDMPAWINDLDADLMCLWLCVRDYTDDLCNEIEFRNITPNTFYELRDKLKKPRHPPSTKAARLRRGIDKLVIHKISYSNMGEMSGSPVGGKNQTGKWKFDVRWNTDSICRSIRKAARKIQSWDITCMDYRHVLKMLGKDDFVFVDPPYVEAGKKCYKHAFDEGDHRELAQRLKRLKQSWALTYDNCEMVHDLYAWATLHDLSFNYFMSSAYRSGQTMKQGNELLITP